MMFRQAVRAHRQRLGLTQEELAAKAGLAVRSLRDLEAGRTSTPRLSSVRLLADAFALTGSDRERFFQAASAGAEGELSETDHQRRTSLAQLPGGIAGFAGRDRELARLDHLAAAAEAGNEGVVIVAVSGPAGVGKTALVRHWSHGVRHRFPDGQLFVDLQGAANLERRVKPEEVLCSMLEAVGIPASQAPADLQSRAALFRSQLAGRRILIVLDSARDADQVRPLLPGTAGCMVVVTSRHNLAGLVASDGAHALRLDVLSRRQARQLLSNRLGWSHIQAESEAAETIITRCAGLPLALTIVAARAATEPASTLTVLAGQLLAHGRLDVFASNDPLTDVRTVFSWSYRHLSPAGGRLFRLLAIHPGPEIGTPAVASLCGQSRLELATTLAELSRVNLIDELRPGRYGLHDLLRAYATELVENDAERETALRRTLDHYLHTATHAATLFDLGRKPQALSPPVEGVLPQRLANSAEALEFFAAERPALIALISTAAANAQHSYTRDLARSLTEFFVRHGHWHEMAETQRAALHAARELDDIPGQAHASQSLARAYTLLRQGSQAHRYYRQALELHNRIDDLTGQADMRQGLAILFNSQGRAEEAAAENHEALRLYRRMGHGPGEALTLNAISWFHTVQGRYEQALACGREALTLHRECGDVEGEGMTLDTLGYTYHHLHEQDKAMGCYEDALRCFHEIANLRLQAETLHHIGDAHSSGDEPDAAHISWSKALMIFDNIGHPEAKVVRAKLQALK